MDATTATRQFIAEVLSAEGLSEDTKLSGLLGSAISLDAGEPDPDATRGPTVTRESDGSVSATDWSFYKLLNINLRDFVELGLGGMTVANIPMDDRLKVVLALGAVLLKFHKKGDVTYSKADAKLLLALHRLQDKPFSHEEIKSAYREEIGNDIPEREFARAVNLLQSVGVLRFRNGKFEVRRKISLKLGWASVGY